MGSNLRRSRFAIALAAVLALAGAGRASAATVQVTEDHSASGCSSTSPVTDDGALVAAWQSNCDPAAGNADGSTEIFRATIGQAPVQLTTGSGCSSSRPSMNGDGNRIAFESNCNLTGGNADGNVEIFLWKNGVLSQLTTSTGCDNLAPSINGAGTFIAFDSTCNTSGTNNDGRGSEIFRVSATGVLKQMTVDPNGGACDSTSPSIDSSGDLVAFDSDCNLVGTNEDFAVEIFTATAGGVVSQRTTAPDDSCSNVRPSMSAEGALIAFQSDCDFSGSNADHGDEIFTVDTQRAVRQVSASGSGNCASGEPRMAASGNALVFSSYCNADTVGNIAGSNGDGSIEVFHAGVGKAQGGILAVTAGSGCSSLGGGLSASGTRVVLDSDCNLATNNADGGVEVFRATACVCGGPSTRKSPPKASDALFALRAAVGSAACALCECDVNNSGDVNASDALKLLKVAVGIGTAASLNCPQP